MPDVEWFEILAERGIEDIQCRVRVRTYGGRRSVGLKYREF